MNLFLLIQTILNLTETDLDFLLPSMLFHDT